jgi:hypothetical protein
MAEQWPFKPLVESSNLSSLTHTPFGEFLVESPHNKGMVFESLLAHTYSLRGVFG